MKRILNILGIGFLVGHFALLFIYCMPKATSKETSRATYIATGYAYPLYDQRWNLFAPAPKMNYRLKFRYKDVDSVWSEDVYPIDTYHSQNAIFSGSSHGRHVLAEYYTAYWVHLELYRKFGINYKSELNDLSNEMSYKETYSAKALEQYIRYYASEKSGRIVLPILEIEDVSTGRKEEVELPEFVYE